MSREDSERLVRLEERQQANFEGRQKGESALQAQLAQVELSITKRLDYQNGRIADHFQADADWMQAHDLAQAEAKGFHAGQMAIVGVFAALGSVIGGGVLAAIVKVLFG